MSISYMRAERCPQCDSILDYFETYSTTGKVCRSCGWKTEWYTGLIGDVGKVVDDRNGQTITISIKKHNEVSK